MVKITPEHAPGDASPVVGAVLTLEDANRNHTPIQLDAKLTKRSQDRSGSVYFVVPTSVIQEASQVRAEIVVGHAKDHLARKKITVHSHYGKK